MEPLPKERSDAKSGGLSSHEHRPQWSRSRRSGATTEVEGVRNAVEWPQWSRSRRSGATPISLSVTIGGRRSLNGAAPEGAERPGRSELARPAICRASMEPLPKERSDEGDDGRTPAECLNGAAPEGAERR